MTAHPMLLCLDEGRRFDSASPGGRCPSCGGPLVSEGAVLKRLAEPALPPDVRLASSVFGDFILIAKIGEGGSGTVHKAWQKSLRRYVAIKFLTADSPKLVSRFLRETRLAAALRHPNIVPVHQVDTIDGRLCLVMDFIDGVTLDETRLDARGTMTLMRDAANAVGFAHKAGVIHRDVKPRNLLVDRAGKIWVVDFGLARLLTSGGTLTKTGDVMGSPCYMAPEQARGGRGDARTDLYGLGAAFYHALTGKPPYDGDSAGAVLAQLIQGNLVPPRAANPRIELAAETILLKCLAKEPRDRYADTQALVDDIERYLAGEPIGATRPGLGSRGWGAVRLHPIAAAAAVVFLAVIVAAAGLMIRQSRHLRSSEAANSRLELRARRVGTMVDRLRMAGELALRGDTTPAALRSAAQSVIEDADQLLAEVPRDAAVHLARGRAWKLLGDLTRAEHDFTEAAALDDQGGGAPFELGLIYLEHLQDSYIGFDERRIVAEFPASSKEWAARRPPSRKRRRQARSWSRSAHWRSCGPGKSR